MIINGSPVGAPGGIPGLEWRSGSHGAPVGEVTRKALAPIKEAANDSKKLAESWGLTGNGAKNNGKMLAESWGLTGSGAKNKGKMLAESWGLTGKAQARVLRGLRRAASPSHRSVAEGDHRPQEDSGDRMGQSSGDSRARASSTRS